MAQVYYNGNPRRTQPVRPRRGAGRRLAMIALIGAIAFGGGFALLWTLGSWIVGGHGLGSGSKGGDVAAAAIVSGQTEYTVEPLVDLLAFRDLSYVPVKGIHLTPNAAGSSETLDPRIGLADRTEINAFVIDVKSDSGWIAYDTRVAMAQDLGTVDPVIKDLDALIATLAEHDIIPIARIVCFKDNVMTKKRPDLAIQDKNGGVWAGKQGDLWLNPYNHEVWDYLVQVAEDCARRGFREIQFDYVRFPTDGKIADAEYPGKYCSKDDAIAGFLAYARPRLEKLGVWVSADVYGLVVTHQTDAFGQQLEKICRSVDVVSPMVYPSHYDTGSFGVEDPNSEPYKIVSNAMQDAAERMVGTGAECRPWLQDFKWANAAYGPDMVKEEIKAAEEQGFDEWLLWGPYRSSTEEALRPQ
jgi:hypothetical protein